MTTVPSEKTSDWLRVGANIGVLVGIFMVLVEIDQNNDLARAQFHHERTEAWGNLKLELADSEFLLAAWEKFRGAGGPRDPAAMDALDDIERARVTQYLMHRYSDYDNLFYQYKEGYLDEEYYQHRVEPSIRALANSWEAIGVFTLARPSFVEEVHRITSDDRN